MGTTIPRLVNDVKYIDTKGTDISKNGGFYGCYGGAAGGLLSNCSYNPWGCYADGTTLAFRFNVKDGYWSYGNRDSLVIGVVLARAFD